MGVSSNNMVRNKLWDVSMDSVVHLLVIHGATMLTVTPLLLGSCVLNDLIRPITPALAAQYVHKGGVSRKHAAEPVKTS